MKIAIELDLKKLMIIGCMALSTWLSCVIGCADALVLVIPAGFACLVKGDD